MAVTERTQSYADLVADDPREFRVHGSVYTEAEVFGSEMARIYGRTWGVAGGLDGPPSPGWRTPGPFSSPPSAPTAKHSTSTLARPENTSPFVWAARRSSRSSCSSRRIATSILATGSYRRRMATTAITAT